MKQRERECGGLTGTSHFLGPKADCPLKYVFCLVLKGIEPTPYWTRWYRAIQPTNVACQIAVLRDSVSVQQCVRHRHGDPHSFGFSRPDFCVACVSVCDGSMANAETYTQLRYLPAYRHRTTII